MDEYEMTHRRKRRLRFLLAAAVVIWVLLTVRLWYIQIHSHRELASAAASQYQVTVEGMDSRGSILDRNLQPLTGGQEHYYYFLMGQKEDNTSIQLMESINARQIAIGSGTESPYHVFRTAYFDETVNGRLRQEYGAYVFRTEARYNDAQTACHLIGYLNEAEKKGVAGLEKAFETILQSDGSHLALWADGGGRLLLNAAPRKEGGRKLLENSLVTTLDLGVQKAAEEILQKKQISGAVLVSHSESGQILAWASSPVFSPNRVVDYLESGSANLVNKCIQGTYPPGSVFKLVVAAAALEWGLADPHEMYHCRGGTEVEGVHLGCRAGPEGGHGKVDMYQAMAQSCNCYFAELGARLGPAVILRMADQLGFGKPVFGIFSEETEGYLPSEEETGPWDSSNLSIGQGRLLVTPAQVQQMMSVIACGGQLQSLTVTAGSSPSASEAKSLLSPYTADQLSAMLALVMEEGTGRGTEWFLPVYGKTGTAEANLGGNPVNQCWFSGFCQIDGEKYTVTILVEQGISGTASALPVFYELCSYLSLRDFHIE